MHALEQEAFVEVLRNAYLNGSASFGADDAIDIEATPARSPAGNTTRHSLELNGPTIASTLSSSASLRRPTTA